MRKIIGIIVCLFLLTTSFIVVSEKVKNRIDEKNLTMDTSLDGLGVIQGNWISMKSYNNYASNGMPDFNQRQDSWQKIEKGANGIWESVPTNDDLFSADNNCICPDGNGRLDTAPGGDDVKKWYYCGPTATANAIWYIDSRHEKNNYPDNNQDTCNLVSKYQGVTDDHSTGNVQPLIEDLAANWLGTSNKCTTFPNDIAIQGWNFFNNSGLINQYKVEWFTQNQININMLFNLIKFSGVVVLRLDTPSGGHFVTLQAVDNVANQIKICDPCYDGGQIPNNPTQHNDASIVNHDLYNVNPQNLSVINYPDSPCTITDAINFWKKPLVDAIFIYPHRTIDMGDSGTELFHVINVEEPTDDCSIYYYLPNGIDYAGGAMVNGAPIEPIIEDNVLKWYLPGMYPGQIYEVEFQIAATSPEELELERRVRVWAYAPYLNTELYDDDFGVLEINDNIPPVIESFYHQFIDDTLSISAEVTDNIEVKRVKVFIKDPEHTINDYEMFKVSGNLYREVFDTSDWITGEYIYYICAEDIAGNEQTSSEKTFTISEEILADAGGPYSGEIGVSIQFYGSAVGGSPPYSYEWDFGDGGDSNEQNPTHIYNNADTYTVTFTVTDSIDDYDEDTTTAEITEQTNNPPNKPSITGPAKGKAGTNYDYKIKTTDPDGDEVWYYIEWGDGTDSGWQGPYLSNEERTFSHTWQSQNTYTIKVKAKDSSDAESEWTTFDVSMPKIKNLGIVLNLFNNMKLNFLFYILLKTLFL